MIPILQCLHQISEKAAADAEEARAALRRTSRENRDQLDRLKEAHRLDVQRRRKIHQTQFEKQAAAIQKQQSRCLELRQKWGDGVTELLNARRLGRRAEHKVEEAKATANKRMDRLTTALQELKGLKAELDDERFKVGELQEKLDEYDMAYDYLQAEYEDHKAEYANVMDFVNRFHEVSQPLMFQKRSVKNATRGTSDAPGRALLQPTSLLFPCPRRCAQGMGAGVG